MDIYGFHLFLWTSLLTRGLASDQEQGTLMDLRVLKMCMFAGFVGEYHPEKNDENSKYVMNTHKQFLIKYNKNQVCV
jgi:hypothetical protein